MIHLHRSLPTKTSELAIVKLFLALGLACIDTVWALYMNNLGLNDSAIGFISSSLVIVSILATFFATPIMEKYDQNKILFLTLLTSIIIFIMIALFKNIVVFIIMAIILTILTIFRINCLDIIFRDSVPDKDLNKAEGFWYTITNVGWVVGPLVAGFILTTFGLSQVFYLVSGFFLIGLIIFSSLHFKKKIHAKVHSSILHNLIKFKTNKKLRLPFLLALGLQVWWPLIYIYTPLFIISQGLDVSIVGLFFAAIIVPMVLLEYNVGKLSSKIGFKQFYVIGFSGLAGLSFSLFFIKNIYWQLIILITASFFVALIEPLQDTFFFKFVCKNNEERYYPIFKTTKSLGSFIGNFSIAGVLLFFPSKFAYLAVAILMSFFVVLSFKIENQ